MLQMIATSGLNTQCLIVLVNFVLWPSCCWFVVSFNFRFDQPSFADDIH